MYMIKSISDDGAVKLARIEATGEVGSQIAVDYKSFASAYQLTNTTIKIINEWVKHSYAESMAYNEAAAKSMITIAFDAASEKNPAIRIQLKPRTAVFAEVSVAANKIALTPFTPKIIITQKTIPNSIEIKSPIDIGDKRIFLQSYTNEESVVPYWFIRITNEESEATLVEKSKIVEIKAGLTKKDGGSIQVTLPTLVNRKAIKAGDELTLYRAPAPKVAKRYVPQALGAALKAPKIA